MKKTVWIIFCFFLFIPAFSQVQVGEYEFTASGSIYQSTNADSRCNPYLKIKANLNTYSREFVTTFESGRRYYLNHKFTFSANERINSIYFYAERGWWVWRPWPFKGFCKGPNEDYTKNLSYPYRCVVYNSSERGYNTCGNALWEDRIEIKVIPLLTVLNPGIANFLPTENKITVKSYTGFHSSEYRWEYSLDFTNWNRIFKFDGMHSISLSAKDILGTNADNMHNQSIYFRQNACGHTSNTTLYKIRISAPKIVSTTPENVRCYDTNDGSIKIQFDRALKQGETLSIGVTNTTANSDHTKSNITAFEADNSYKIENLPTGNYSISLLGNYKGFPTYTDGAEHQASATINKPAPVSFTVTKAEDVRCYGGHDGILELNASGGIGRYEYHLSGGNITAASWASFSGASSHTINLLHSGTYRLKVRDGNGCLAREIVRDASGTIIGLGNTIEETVTINIPKAPLSVAFVSHKEPTAHGFTDGYIRAQITGGTPLANGTYSYSCTYEDGSNWTDITEAFYPGNDGWFLTLNNAPAGRYTLRVTDANHSAAVHKDGCKVDGAGFTLQQPEPLTAQVIRYHEISCNRSNSYGDETDRNPRDGQRDESQDGALVARVTGGVRFLSGPRPYKYTWKKQQGDGTWKTMSQQNDSIAINLSDGNYAFNVEDANGIILGEYSMNRLVREKDIEFYLHEPPPLTVSVTTTPVSCSSGADGSAKLTVQGGTPPYSYRWSGGITENSDEVSGLQAGNYLVFITDAKGCQTRASVTIAQPDGLKLELLSKKDPTCYQASDGHIKLKASGGVPPYSYRWSTGQKHGDLSDLPEGEYTVTVEDTHGCRLVNTFVLSDPQELTVALGADRVLCEGQTHTMDASIDDRGATYRWTSDNGFTATDPAITVSDPGTYKVEVTDSDGCIARDEVEVRVTKVEIDAEFLMPVRAYVNEEVVIVNVSSPVGEATEWQIPDGVEVLSKEIRSLRLRFAKAGMYTIALVSKQGDCFAEFAKSIYIEEGAELPDPGAIESPFIREFLVIPNPNEGVFKVQIELAKQASVVLRVVGLDKGLVADVVKGHGQSEYTFDFKLSLPDAVYMIILETAKETQLKRMIKI